MSAFADSVKTCPPPVLIPHRRADRDSLGAAVGLRAILQTGAICLPAGTTQDAAELRELTDAPICEGVLPSHCETAVVLDTPSADRISPIDLDSNADSVLVIDHHEPADLVQKADNSYTDTDAGATAELVGRVALEAGWELPADAALPLLVGIFDDTHSLTTGGPQTVATATALFSSLTDTETALLPDLLTRSVRRDERLASATSMLRCHGYRGGDLFVGFSQVGAHEGTAAETLQSAGIDLAVVYSEQGEKLRVTARASDRMATQLSLGSTLLPDLAKTFGGDGGGHDAAGGAKIATTDTDAVTSAILTAVESTVGETFTEV